MVGKIIRCNYQSRITLLRSLSMVATLSPLVSSVSLLALLHVFLEGRSFVDGLAFILILFGLDVTSVVFTTHGPAKFGSRLPVRFLVEESRALEGSLRRGKGTGTCNEGGNNGELGLQRQRKKGKTLDLNTSNKNKPQ